MQRRAGLRCGNTEAPADGSTRSDHPSSAEEQARRVGIEQYDSDRGEWGDCVVSIGVVAIKVLAFDWIAEGVAGTGVMEEQRGYCASMTRC